ncbi:MTH1187 family thiamine-binding protein [Neobacillus mesonae]|uniref:MTH1187 family thiamine-binding protein n=1 Tax=Neobacillus mesonae TaxID=1193713 RepID=UPI002E2425D7|nr:MTH1187 family thiamine-binding protein [Neobacillus mesonae]
MAIVDITVIPVGTATPSVSGYVAEIHKFLKWYEGKIKYELTPMSTLIEGDLKELLEIVQQLHELPFQKGAQRVCTNIRIDDRRDKENTMERKLKAVESKL